MICDGAKKGCALKVAVAAEVAVRSALLAFLGIGPSRSEGIVDENPLITLRNISEISREMRTTDKKIVSISYNSSINYRR